MRAHVLGQGFGRPVQRVPHQPAVVAEVRRMEEAVADGVSRPEAEHRSAQTEREREQQACPAGAEWTDRGEHGPQHQRRAGCEQRQRDQVCDAAEQEAQGDRKPTADLAAVPAEVEHEREEGREREEPEARHVEVALLQLRQLRLPQPREGRRAARAATAASLARSAAWHRVDADSTRAGVNPAPGRLRATRLSAP